MNSETQLIPSVSVIVPSLNEEDHLAATVATILRAANSIRCDLEIIIIDDGSADQTGAIAEQIANDIDVVKVVHNPVPTGLGHSYRQGAVKATKEYVTMIPGDNETPEATVRAIIEASRDDDLILTYVMNPDVRGRFRRLLSGSFVRLVRLISGFKIRYFNGNNSIRKRAILDVPMEFNGHVYMAVTVVRLLRKGYTYRELGVWLQRRESGRSTAFALHTVAEVGVALASLLKERFVLRRL